MKAIKENAGFAIYLVDRVILGVLIASAVCAAGAALAYLVWSYPRQAGYFAAAMVLFVLSFLAGLRMLTGLAILAWLSGLAAMGAMMATMFGFL